MLRFATWLRDQREIQRGIYGYDVDAASPEERMEYIRLNNLAAHTELAESLQQLDWKPWRQGESNRHGAVNELVDVLFFVANMLLQLGVTDDELNERYEAKVEINRNRQLFEDLRV